MNLHGMDNERRNKMHYVIDIFLNAYNHARNKDIFISTFLCCLCDVLPLVVIRSLVKEAAKWDEKRATEERVQ